MNKHFEFKDWKQAFKEYYERCDSESELALVISRHWVTSGYWIETNPKPTPSKPDILIYRGKEEVKALEKRILDRGEEIVKILSNNQPLKRKNCLNLDGLVI